MDIIETARMLSAAGPYGLVAVLGWAYWRQSEKKDSQLKFFFDDLLQITKSQTDALLRVEVAISELRASIDRRLK